MNITSTKYGKDSEGNNHCIIVVSNGVTLFVPLDSENADYLEVMRQVDAGDITIAAAD